MIRTLIYCLLLTATLTACGAVITPQPSAGPSPLDAPTPEEAARARGGTTTAPALPAADTATPTVPPTPIVYVVQPGDTLLEIAQDYGVSVEALQAANGIDDPRLLRPGQELVIPTGDESEGAAPGLLLPTPTPAAVDVRGIAFYETPVGSLWCLGEIVNPTPDPLTNVQVRVTLFDASGERAAEKDVFAAADLVPAGARTPFGILFSSPPAWSNFQVTVLRAEAAGELTASYIPIDVVDAEGNLAGPQFQVTGVVRDASDTRAASTVSVIATTYDGQGAVTGFRHDALELEEALNPGEEASFAVLFSFHGDSPADFSVVALGRTSE